MLKSAIQDLLISINHYSVSQEIITYNINLADKTLQEVLDYSSNPKELNDKIYYCALLLGKIEESSNIPWPKLKEALNKSLDIINFNSDSKEDFIKCFDNVLCKILKEIKKFKDIISMAEFLKVIKANLEKCFSAILIYNHASQYFLSEFAGYHQRVPEPENYEKLKNYKRLLKYLLKGIEYEIDLKCYFKIILPKMINMLEEIVNIPDLAHKKEERELVWKAIDIIEKVNIEDAYIRKKVKEICKLLKSNGIYNYKNRKPADNFLIQPSELTKDDKVYSIKRCDFFKSRVFKGTWEGKSVCLKNYQKIKGSGLQIVKNEINLYKEAAKLKEENGCFLDYYGTCEEETNDGQIQITLVMQWVDKTLTEYIKGNDILSEDMLKVMFFKILNSFSLLHDQEIFHRDVKPDNILKDDQSYYIIDFDVSVKDNGPKTRIYKTINENWAGTNNYADPEIQNALDNERFDGYYYAKADVFSLGMTFYHILVREKFESGLNKKFNEGKLMKGIIESPYDWAKKLLRKMLDFDKTTRISMKDALNLLRTKTRINPEIYNPQTELYVIQ